VVSPAAITSVFSTGAAAFSIQWLLNDDLCGLVVRVPGYRSRGSIPGATRFSEK
jgi:hypothetical protein